jgi:hypothetical protein
MEAVSILRELWRRRPIVGVVVILAVLGGLMVAFRVSLMPPALQSRSYDVGLATARMLVDTPNSQVIAVSPKGSELLGARASLLSTLMTEGRVKADIARRVGLRPKELIATAESGAGSAEAAPVRKPGPDARVLTTRVLTNNVGEQLPIIEVEAQGPDTEAAARLANAAVNSLRESLDSRAASENVADARRLRVTALGPPEVREAGRGPRALLGLVAALFLFAAGCGLTLLLASLARGWREADAAESNVAWPVNDATGIRRSPLLLLPGREDDQQASAAPYE